MVDSSWNVTAHGDAREGKWRGNSRMEWVTSTLHTTSEHGVSSITTADAHTSAASSRLNWRPSRFKWTRPFRRKTKSAFCSCAITFQLAYTNPKHSSPLTHPTPSHTPFLLPLEYLLEIYRNFSSWAWSCWLLKLTTHLHSVPILRMYGAVTSVLHMHSWCTHICCTFTMYGNLRTPLRISIKKKVMCLHCAL